MCSVFVPQLSVRSCVSIIFVVHLCLAVFEYLACFCLFVCFVLFLLPAAIFSVFVYPFCVFVNLRLYSSLAMFNFLQIVALLVSH